MGWRVEGSVPPVPKLVMIVAPHTSNWDFVVGILVYLALELDATWFGKHSLFHWPMGPILRRFGGIPVRRDTSTNVVDLYVGEFAKRERMVLALTPEGTRSLVKEWRTGFYHIAVGAGALISPVAFDYRTRRVRFLETLTPTGDAARDIAVLRSRFSAPMARHPAAYNP